MTWNTKGIRFLVQVHCHYHHAQLSFVHMVIKYQDFIKCDIKAYIQHLYPYVDSASNNTQTKVTLSNAFHAFNKLFSIIYICSKKYTGFRDGLLHSTSQECKETWEMLLPILSLIPSLNSAFLMGWD